MRGMCFQHAWFRNLSRQSPAKEFCRFSNQKSPYHSDSVVEEDYLNKIIFYNNIK